MLDGTLRSVDFPALELILGSLVTQSVPGWLLVPSCMLGPSSLPLLCAQPRKATVKHRLPTESCCQHFRKKEFKTGTEAVLVLVTN